MSVYLSDMESLTTAEAAERAGVTVRQWHYYRDKLRLVPERKLSGPRGAQFWSQFHVDAIRQASAERAA